MKAIAVLRITISTGALALSTASPAFAAQARPDRQEESASSSSSAIRPNEDSVQTGTGLPTADVDAPPTQGGTLDDIIVTAQKRAESISKAPLAVSAVGQQALDRLGGNTFETVLRTVPSVTAGLGGLAIRGLGGATTVGFGASTVAIHVDGIYTSDLYPPSYDVDRIEVLRGPQGTLYGRNSTAGVVNIITAKPVDRLTGTGDIGIGENGRMTARAMINLPITDTLAIRASGTYDRDEGSQFYPGDAFASTGVVTPANKGDQINRYNGRVALRWRPFESLEWNVNVGFDHDRNSPRTLVPGFYANFPNFRAPVTAPVPISPLLPPVRLVVVPGARDFSNPIVYPSGFPRSWAFQPAGSDRLGGFRRRNRNDTETLAVRSNLAYDINDDLRASYLFGFRREHSRNVVQTVPFALSTVLNLEKEYSHELNLNYEGERLRGVLGAYAFRSRLDDDDFVSVWIPNTSTDATPPFTPPVLSPAIVTSSNDKLDRSRTYAVFGQLTFDVTDRFRVTGGARYNSDRVGTTDHTVSLCPFGQGLRNGIDGPPSAACTALAGLPNIAYAAITGQPITRGQLTGTEPFPPGFNPFTTGRIVPSAFRTFKETSFKGTAEYDFAEDVLGYATVATGYKAGGIGNQTLTGDDRFFDPETDINYEAGIRSKLFDNRLSLNLTGFWTDYDDLQVATIQEINGRAQNVTANAAKSRVRGAEFEFGWAISPNDRLSGYATYLDAKIRDYPNVQDNVRNTVVANVGGNRLTNAPELTVRGVYSRIFGFGSLGTLTPTLQGQYQTVSYTNLLNQIEHRIDDRFTADVNLRYETRNQNFYVEGIVTNVTNRKFVQAEFPVTGGGFQLLRYDPGRIWSARVGVKF